MIATTHRRLIAGLTLALLGSTSAYAADATAFANRLKDVATTQGIPVAFASAEAQGDNVVLKDVTFGAGADAAKVGDVTFEGVTGSDAEGWKVARVPIADVQKTEDGSTLKVSGIRLEGLQIGATGEDTKIAGNLPFFFDIAAVQSVDVTKDSQKVFSLADANFTNTVDGEGIIGSSMSTGNLSVDFATAPPELKTTMSDLGYNALSGASTLEMSWNPKTGDLAVEPFDFTVENAGVLSLGYEIGGYTQAFVKSLGDMQKQMAANPGGAQNSGMAMLGLLSQLSLGSLSISFADDSLTGRLLDYYSKKNGQTREQLVQQIDATVPAMLASLNNADFTKQVSTAVSTFLADPQSFSIDIAPEQPIPATQIMGAAMGAPQTLPQVLQLQVTANAPQEGEEGMGTDEPDGDAGTANDAAPQ